VALVSARRGDGLAQISTFLSGALPTPTPVLLPVLQDVPHCRRWAGDVGSKAGYRAPGPNKWTRRLDEILLHPVAGPLAFLVVVIAVFQVIFAIGAPLHDVVGDFFDHTEKLLVSVMPPSLVRSILIEGVWRGVGSVLAFLPQILFLFLFIGVLEDSGYLARAAVIADRTMARVGLQGKSFIPLLSAYSCAVPAIMATRTIENRRDRLATILIAPFMTCSARIPAYMLIILAFIPKHALLGPLMTMQTAAMLGLYVLGFLAAVATAKILKSTVLKSTRTPFLMEMPSYRMPSPRSLGLRVLDRGIVFVKQAGTIILLVTVVLAILLNVPYVHGNPPEIGNSVAGMIGHGIEPLVRPLGLNWKVGIGLLTSLVARETMPATLGTIYGAEHESTSVNLQTALQHDMTLGAAVALLVFFAFALQCMSTVAIVRRETGSWKWPIAQFTYMGALAWVGAFVAYRLIH
jgi:ferrous iron transport protein B